MTHWLHPALELRPHPCGKGIFTTLALPKGTRLVVWGGRVLSESQIFGLDEVQRTHAIQIDHDLFLAPPWPLEPGDYVNHSCDPSAGFRASNELIAMRDVPAGSEITFDYAMSDTAPYDEFSCACGSALCRGKVTASDHRLKALRARYAGYWSPYVQRRIDGL